MSDKSTVDFRWLQTGDFPFPKDRKFACTGFREDEGIDEMFSIIVHLTGNEEISRVREADIEALVEPMSNKLPKRGERFYVTSGQFIVAECVGK